MSDEKRRNGHVPKLDPDYIDEAKGKLSINKITLAPGDSEREHTYLLKPHVGRAGREKDTEILGFLTKMQEKLGGEGDMTDIQAIMKLVQDEDSFSRIALMTLDLDEGDGPELFDNLTLFERVLAFQKGMRYRTGDMHREVVESAIKKLKGEVENQKAAE